MKVGNLVTTRSRNFIGVIIDSRVLDVSTGAVPSGLEHLRSLDLNSHYVYWSDSKVEKNPVWVKERDLVRVI